MRIAITGATGLIGQAATRHFRSRGDTVLPVSRRDIAGGVRWNPAVGSVDAAALEGVDVVVNLAGESLADGRWTAARKVALRASRLQSTTLIAGTIAQLRHPPSLLVSASAIGIYGDHAQGLLDEDSRAGTGFLADLCVAWEGAADAARHTGIRVVHPRFGIILAAGGGALGKFLPMFRLGLGGPLGDGQQWMSWVAMADVLGAIDHIVSHGALAGPVNIVAPGAVRNRDFTAALGTVLGRPALLPVPAAVLRLAFGEMADGAVLASQHVVPQRLLDSGFPFAFPVLDAALRQALSRAAP